MTAESVTQAAVGGQDRRRWFALALIVAAQFMVVLDIAIVNVALPSIRTDLNFSQESLQWVITAYSIFFGGVLLLGGRLADLLGRRRLFVVGLALFTVSSLLDGLAWSEGSLIAFRSLQGLGAALLSPAALSILTTTFREGRERNLALGIWGAASGSGGAAGVLLGGALTSALSWSWIFFINVPVGVAVIALTPVPAPREPRRPRPPPLRPRRRRLDHRRADAARLRADARRPARLGAPPRRSACSPRPPLLIGAFFVIELRSKAPLLPLRIFRLRTLIGLERQRPADGRRDLRAVLPAHPVHAGGAALLGAQDRRRLHRPDADDHRLLRRRPGARHPDRDPAGAARGARALDACARAGSRRLPVDGHYFRDLFPPFIISGLGLALAFVPMSIGGLTGVREADAGIASGLINTTQQIGGAIGVAVATTVATTFTSRYVDAHAGTNAFSGAALTHGFQIAFYVLAALAGLGAVLVGAHARVEARRRPSSSSPTRRCPSSRRQ